MMDAFKDMYDVVVDRRANPQEGSYTCYLCLLYTSPSPRDA